MQPELVLPLAVRREECLVGHRPTAADGWVRVDSGT
jgi:hypothetical protein